jgi:hypothetical protein
MDGHVRLFAIAATGLVHGLGWMAIPLIVPHSPVWEPPVCLDCGWGVRWTDEPIISLQYYAGPDGRGVAIEASRGRQTCRGPDVDRVAAPLFSMFQGRPLVRGEARRDPVACVLIGRDGRPGAIRWLHRSGSRGTDSLAAEALRELRFRPAERRGSPVAAWHQVTLHVGAPNYPMALPPLEH